jgi:hypothetical protein
MHAFCNRFQKWKPPVGSIVSGFFLCTAVLCLTAGCSKSDGHVAVHPAAGTIKFRGQPLHGAFVSLHPRNPLEGVPNPRATVDNNGSFAVSTYDADDGAPEGEYVVTVQWFKPVRQGNDLVGGPNVLPPKYASPRTSDLKIRIAAGENTLPALQLR